MKDHSANFVPATLKLIEEWQSTELKIEQMLLSDQLSLSQVPEILVTTRHAIITVIKNPLLYFQLPFRVRSNEMGLLACQLDYQMAKLLPIQVMSWVNSQLTTPILEFFPEQYRVDQLCEIALKTNQENVKFLPSKLFQDRDYLESLVFRYPNSLLYIDEDKVDNELYNIALNSDKFELKFVPTLYRTEEICREAFKRNHTAFFDMPSEYIREEDVYSMVERCEKEEVAKVIKNLKSEHESFDLWLNICKKDSSNIRYVPAKFLTEHFVSEVAPFITKASHIKKFIPEHIRSNNEVKYRLIDSNPMLLEAIPEKDRDHFLCRKAVQANGMALQFVPFNIADIDMNILALQQNGLSLKYIPQPYRDLAYPKIAVQQNGEAIEHVPLQYQTEEICRIAVNQNAKAIYHIHTVKMIPEFCLIAIRKDPSDLSMIPINYRNHEICKIALNHSASNYQYIPEHLKTTADILAITEYYKGQGIFIEGLNTAEV